jgi:hypothetical protein
MTPRVPALLAPALAALLAVLGLLGGAAHAADPRAAGAPAAAASAPAQPRQAPVKVAQGKPEAKPTWSELTPAQQQALAPLTGGWSKLSEAHKRKWLAVSQNYPAMPPGEQARLHTRMAEWAALTPQQRIQARHNYFEVQSVPSTDRKAQWDAYQALSPEEKRKLAAKAKAAKPATPSTAPAVQPAQQKLATVPKPKETDARSPRIATAPAAAPVPPATTIPAEANSYTPEPAVPGARPHQP